MNQEQIELCATLINGMAIKDAEVMSEIALLAAREIPNDLEEAHDTIEMQAERISDLTTHIESLDKQTGNKLQSTNINLPKGLRISLLFDGTCYAATAFHEKAGTNFTGIGDTPLDAIEDLAHNYPS